MKYAVLLLTELRKASALLPAAIVRTAELFLVTQLQKRAVAEGADGRAACAGHGPHVLHTALADGAEQPQHGGLHPRVTGPVLRKLQRFLRRNGQPDVLDQLVPRPALAGAVEPEPGGKDRLDRLIDRAEKTLSHPKSKLQLFGR